MVEILAVLSASAAAGLRIGLPLLLVGLLWDNLWFDVPLLSQIPPQVIVGVLVSWSLFELFASKKLLGQRIVQIVQLIFSPVAGTIVGIAVARATGIVDWQAGLLRHHRGFAGVSLAVGSSGLVFSVARLTDVGDLHSRYSLHCFGNPGARRTGTRRVNCNVTLVAGRSEVLALGIAGMSRKVDRQKENWSKHQVLLFFKLSF